MQPASTHIEQQKRKAANLKSQVMQLLNWDDLTYCEFQLEMGRQYLQSYIPRDPDGIDALLECRIFWNWWRNHWMLRDEQFLLASNIKNKLTLYRELHNPEFLIREIYLNGMVLSTSYGQMIGEVIDANKNVPA
ncbi:MAG: hypothetical protein Q8K66_04130 [Sediminibacterium sp.]|nr:hypothetical protein [Sediminibacterium sp.]MDP3128127.1 hypothetical protein [Sediminibacterium sp.]